MTLQKWRTVALVALAACALILLLGASQSIVGRGIGTLEDRVARLEWLSAPLSHMQTQSRAESLMQVAQALPGVLWLHHRPYWSDTSLYFGFVKFHDDTVRQFAFINPNTGFLVAGEADAIVGNEVVGATADSILKRTGLGIAASPYKLRLDTTRTVTWTALQTMSNGIVTEKRQVTVPPTAAGLDVAFGANLPNGFIGVGDRGTETYHSYIVFRANAGGPQWFYIEGTRAP